MKLTRARPARVPAAISLFTAALFASAGLNAADWLQFGYDAAHSQVNPAEAGYSTASGNRLLYSVPLDCCNSNIAPVFASSVATSAGVKDLIFEVTDSGELRAFDAADGALVWSQKPAVSGSVTWGAPAIDPDRMHIYAFGLDGNVHKYQIGDGAEVVSGGWPQISTLKPGVEKGASALTIAESPQGKFLYAVTSGYYGDGGDYQGHITTIDLASGQQKVFNSLCSDMFIHFDGNPGSDCVVSGPDGQKSGIWGSAGAVYDRSTDRVYFATGNGLFDANTAGGHEWGDSVLALNANGSGAGLGLPVDSYTPSSFDHLYLYDVDLGSSSPVILPTSGYSNYRHLGLHVGKDGCVLLLNFEDLSNHGGPGNVGGELNADACNFSSALGSVLYAHPGTWVNPADHSVWIFVPATSELLALRMGMDDLGNPTLVPNWNIATWVSSPIIANDQLYYLAGGQLHVVDPASGSLIWQSDLFDSVHWGSPIVVNGRIYVFAWSHLIAFELDGIFRQGF